nr:heparinase II/III family protein [Duganella sp. CY15W]
MDSLPLSDQYAVSGSVTMCDTWNYADATRLDFKSSPFSSENHQHLDQNHFSLFYRAPLLVDSGAYDDHNSTHWFNDYRHTIAHSAWRIEISPVPKNAVASYYQFFLNVLWLADNDPGDSAPVANTSRLLSCSDASADTVDIDSNITVVFARNFRNVTQLRWKPNNSSANVLIVGMLPSTAYSKTRDLATGEWIISRVASPVLNLRSSANGVIEDFAN